MIGSREICVARVTGDRGDRRPRTAIVVGAGIVGLSTAWFLQQRGVEVIVLDRDGVAAGASGGNAGWITPGLVALHEPAALRFGLRSLIRPIVSRHSEPCRKRKPCWVCWCLRGPAADTPVRLIQTGCPSPSWRSSLTRTRPTPVADVYLAGGHDLWGFAHGPVIGRMLAEQIATGVQPEALQAFDPLRSAVKWRVRRGESMEVGHAQQSRTRDVAQHSGSAGR